MRFSFLTRLPLIGAGGFLTRRLRHLIIVPYLILAMVLALTVTYLLASAANQSLTDRFNSQLLDAAQSGASRLTQAESQQLQALRSIGFTEGFADALMKSDTNTLSALTTPQKVNYDLDTVIVVSKDGRVLFALPQQTGSASPGLNDLVQAALNPSGESDKVSGLVGSSQGDGIFYTAGPVRQGDQIVGAVLVGSDLSRLLKQIGRDSLSDGITYYGSSGMPMGTALAESAQPAVVPTLPADWYAEITANSGDKVKVRTVTLGNDTYVEAFGAVPGRGLGDQPPGVYGVMLRTHALDANLEQTLWAMLPIFGIGLALTVVIGLLLAVWIDRPLTQLMIASGKVARGDLEVQVPEGRHDELGVLSARFNDMVEGLRQLFVVKDLFGRFVSPEVSAKLLAGQIELGGELREVTILFSDLRGFTTLAAERSPAEIVDLLNEYFGIVVGAATRHGGIVNKFGGDSTLIIFGAPLDMPDHADRALSTALDMETALREMSARRVKNGWRPITEGIGINTGPVVAGQIGSLDRMEYTVIGDAVNVAARLQEITKKVRNSSIIFSESTLAALADPGAWLWTSQGQFKISGKKEPITVFGLQDRISSQQTEQKDVAVQSPSLPSESTSVATDLAADASVSTIIS